MQCYEHLAATVVIADTIDCLHGFRKQMPFSVVSSWMEEAGIEAEEVLAMADDDVRALVEAALHREMPGYTRAA